jgi:hypothetical protein
MVKDYMKPSPANLNLCMLIILKARLGYLNLSAPIMFMLLLEKVSDAWRNRSTGLIMICETSTCILFSEYFLFRVYAVLSLQVHL